MSDQQSILLPGPDQRVIRLKEITGIAVANCLSCACGVPDEDGDYAELYCGMTCKKRLGPEFDEVYLEDQGIDLQAEKACWEPAFWHSQFAATGTEDSDGYADFVTACAAVR